MTDGDLVRRALIGDRAAGEELAHRWSARVLAFCHARVGNRHTAEDLAQETLLRGLRGLHTLESPEKFGSWLRGIAAHICLDWRKSKQARQVSFTSFAPQRRPDDLVASSTGPTQCDVDDADELRWLMQEVESLSLEHREVLLLYYYQDVTYRDLADWLGVSAATINARLTQARAILRRRIVDSQRCFDEL
jgi:RNA polymerase sigma-70 factor (ECF subfamily)